MIKACNGCREMKKVLIAVPAKSILVIELLFAFLHIKLITIIPLNIAPIKEANITFVVFIVIPTA